MSCGVVATLSESGVEKSRPSAGDGRQYQGSFSRSRHFNTHPVFIATSRNVSVSAGERAVLKCRVQHLGTKTVSESRNWRHSSRRLLRLTIFFSPENLECTRNRTVNVGLKVEDTWYSVSSWGNLITEALRYGTRCQGIMQLNCHPRVYPWMKWTLPCFRLPKPKLVLFYRLRRDRRLSWPSSPPRWINSLPRTATWRVSQLLAIQTVTPHSETGANGPSVELTTSLAASRNTNYTVAILK